MLEICKMKFIIIQILIPFIHSHGKSVQPPSREVVRRQSAQFSFSSVKEAALPMLHPLVAAGSDKCEILKNFFGLTYEQMRQEKANIDMDLHIDYITNKGFKSIKLNNTRINQLFGNGDSIVVLIHGFMESSEGMMVQAIAPELLKKKGYRIMALDGRKLMSFEYFSSTTNVRFIGEKLGTVLADAVLNGQPASNITLIGHSLGAHIAGVAGKTVANRTQQLVGRIVALDPAGPCFSNVSLAGRLDPGDAAYVDVVHTSAGILGLNEPVGNKDFYPNGGVTQDGCYISTCDHTQAWIYFLETINKPYRFPARKCDSWEHFKEGKCANNEVVPMGWESSPLVGSDGTYYLTTEPSTPYKVT